MAQILKICIDFDTQDQLIEKGYIELKEELIDGLIYIQPVLTLKGFDIMNEFLQNLANLG